MSPWVAFQPKANSESYPGSHSHLGPALGKAETPRSFWGESEVSHLEHITDDFRGDMDKEPSVGCDNVEIFKDFSTSSGC